MKLIIRNAHVFLTKIEKKKSRKAWVVKEVVRLIDKWQKYKNSNTKEGQLKYYQLENQVN